MAGCRIRSLKPRQTVLGGRAPSVHYSHCRWLSLSEWQPRVQACNVCTNVEFMVNITSLILVFVFCFPTESMNRNFISRAKTVFHNLSSLVQTEPKRSWFERCLISQYWRTIFTTHPPLFELFFQRPTVTFLFSTQNFWFSFLYQYINYVNFS